MATVCHNQLTFAGLFSKEVGDGPKSPYASAKPLVNRTPYHQRSCRARHFVAPPQEVEHFLKYCQLSRMSEKLAASVVDYAETVPV